MTIKLVWKKSTVNADKRSGGRRGLYKLLMGDAIVGLIENDDDSDDETRAVWALMSRTNAKNPPFEPDEEFDCRQEARCKVEAAVVRLLKMMFVGACRIEIDGSVFDG